MYLIIIIVPVVMLLHTPEVDEQTDGRPTPSGHNEIASPTYRQPVHNFLRLFTAV